MAAGSLKALELFGLLVACAGVLLFINIYNLEICPPTSTQKQIPFRRQEPPIETDQSSSECNAEYKRVTSSRTSELTDSDYETSLAYAGNRYRLSKFASKLQQNNEALSIVVCGGSITLGHGVQPHTARYSDQLQEWLQINYPLKRSKHKVVNLGSHGADMCAMAKRMHVLDDLDQVPDMFVLEFAVNDYQGQDHRIHVDHKTDVFFDGFHRVASCAETVIYKLLTKYPDTAVIFLEFQTAILNRKTAQLLHMGVAQHYQVPVISYAAAMFPGFLKLAEALQPYSYSIPKSLSSTNSSVIPYPHGCATCDAQSIVQQFRGKGCKSVCVFMKRSGYYDGECDLTGLPCYVPFLAHDAVHPSAVGHSIARDLIVEAIVSTGKMLCKGKTFSQSVFPWHSGWLVAGSNYHQELQARSDFVMVKDTMEVFVKKDPLESKEHSDGFEMAGDQLADRKGWIATNPSGGESIAFEIDLPVSKSSCYAVYISVLKSYESVGAFSVTVEDKETGAISAPIEVDCLWKPRISIPADIQLTFDDNPGCSGKCIVLLKTQPEISGRGGNKIKIMSLSARKCIPIRTKGSNLTVKR